MIQMCDFVVGCFYSVLLQPSDDSTNIGFYWKFVIQHLKDYTLAATLYGIDSIRRKEEEVLVG